MDLGPPNPLNPTGGLSEYLCVLRSYGHTSLIASAECVLNLPMRFELMDDQICRFQICRSCGPPVYLYSTKGSGCKLDKERNLDHCSGYKSSRKAYNTTLKICIQNCSSEFSETNFLSKYAEHCRVSIIIKEMQS